MNEAEARRAVSAIIADLRRENADCKSMISTVSNLTVEVGRWGLFKQEEPQSGPLSDESSTYQGGPNSQRPRTHALLIH
jgi:hypothetical protein